VGQDPALHKKEEKRRSQLNSDNSFEVIAREWYDIQKGRWTPRHAAYVLKRLQSDVFPEIGVFPIADITAPQLLAAIRKVESRGAHEIAHRALQTAGQVFRYAIVTGRAERSPASDLKGALKPVPRGHFAAFDYRALPDFVKNLERNDARLYLHTRLAVRMLLLTFVRTSELINATFKEFDLEAKEWIIPAERIKMRNPHVVPLSRQVLDIVTQLKELNGVSPWLFPNQVEPRKSMSNNTVLKALERMGYKGEMTGHGFRTVASTWANENGYGKDAIEKQLAHSPDDKVRATYNRADFMAERRVMLQAYADWLMPG
jgi:integrase